MSVTLHTLPKVTTRAGKRLGRGYGSGKGAKSTRGTTRHQRGREHIPLSFEGGQNRLVKRFPLLRGKSKNKSVQMPSVIVHLDKLEVFDNGAVINTQALIDKNIIREVAPYQQVKILARGALTKKLTVSLPVSSKAKELIEGVGGTTSGA